MWVEVVLSVEECRDRRDQSTVWELSVAVLRIPCDESSTWQVVRWEDAAYADANLIWPHRRDADMRPLTAF